MEAKHANAAQHYAGGFTGVEATDVPRAPIIEELFPGMASPAIAAALGNRVSDAQVRLWKTGRRPVPAWVREYARVKIERLRRALEATPTGPGSQVGWRNVKGYQLNMRR